MESFVIFFNTCGFKIVNNDKHNHKHQYNTMQKRININVLTLLYI